jgi:hypothetical protein
VGLAGLKSQTQSHSCTEQMLLADHFAKMFGAQTFGQGLMRNGW